MGGAGGGRQSLLVDRVSHGPSLLASTSQPSPALWARSWREQAQSGAPGPELASTSQPSPALWARSWREQAHPAALSLHLPDHHLSTRLPGSSQLTTHPPLPHLCPPGFLSPEGLWRVGGGFAHGWHTRAHTKEQ